ncbi:hypothetical protein [Cellulomonas sp.]|uniref:hypothetical protein n=1 Tax=Cellulomonas sp. TaxID=40001 RepID=UPI00258BE6AA|nr:hypothetical protein [Cellulomonas sp.]MCR6690394.1 hypothetical protein [Cellulomonas sp.]
MSQPVLMVYGTGDASMPIVQGAEQVIRDTAIAGNGAVTVRYYAGATHGIKVDEQIVPAFLRDMTGWVVGLPATAHAEPKIAGDQPEQQYLAMPVPEPRWLHNGDVVALITIAAIAGIVLAGMVGGVARGVRTLTVRRTGVPAPAGAPRFAGGVVRWATALGVGAVATVVALVWYIFAIARLALEYEHNAWVVQGGWVAVRLLGIGVVGAAVLLSRAVVRARTKGVAAAPGALRVVVLGLLVVCSSVLLVVLAYWGVYQLGI